MSLAVLSFGLEIIGGIVGEPEQAAIGADQLAQTCLSESAGLFVLSVAAGRESPNENAARQAVRISQICRTARTGLAPVEHVCLASVAHSEHLAEAVADVYSGRVAAVDFASMLSERDPAAEADDPQIEMNEQCEDRMSALKDTMLAGETQ